MGEKEIASCVKVKGESGRSMKSRMEERKLVGRIDKRKGDWKEGV